MIKALDVADHVWKWLLDSFRHAAPFLICLLGGLALVALHGKGWPGPLIAGILFLWALDLAANRASAKARSEAAALIIDSLMSGQDTRITVDVNYKSALNEQATG